MTTTSQKLAHVLSGNYLVWLCALFDASPVLLRDWAIPVTVFATIVIVNSVKKFDGLDGLASSQGVSSSWCSCRLCLDIGDVNAAKVAVRASALDGFLLQSTVAAGGRHRTFISDSGSLGSGSLWPGSQFR